MNQNLKKTNLIYPEQNDSIEHVCAKTDTFKKEDLNKK